MSTFLHCVASDEFHQLLAQPGRIIDTVRAVAQRLQGAVAGTPEPVVSHQVDPKLAVCILSALQGTTADRWSDNVCALTLESSA